tara:strand:+ start:114 stop:890 length:777 start_codon:yes stop_codon:yes gene_type:complete
MRLFLIIDETHFYHPSFVQELIKKTKHKIVGAGLVTKILPKNNIEYYMIRNFFYLKISELFKLATKKLYLKFKNFSTIKKNTDSFYSVRNVFEHFEIDYFEIENDINQKHYIDKIQMKSPDIIISSNSLIFGNKILKIPKYCINRHSALLPAYGGLWPVFQAVRKKEKKVGVSIHTMEKKIDKGILLAQKVIKIEKEDTVDTLYQKCFACSAQLVLDAIKKIEINNIQPISNNYIPSYFSFPKKRHWKQFRKTGIKFI